MGETAVAKKERGRTVAAEGSDGGRTAIMVGIAFGIVFFLVLIGLATAGIVSQTTPVNTTTLEQTASSFMQSFGNILTIVLLVFVVLGSLGVKNIIQKVMG